MNRLPLLIWLAAVAALQVSQPAIAQQRAPYEKLVETHAKANLVPAALVHRVIVRESKYQADLIGRGGTIGLMQIKLATARGVGYRGDAEGLRDPDTNLTYGVKYLAGAYRAANGDHDRAVHLYAAGYYEVAKRQRLERGRPAELMLASATPLDTEKPQDAAKNAQTAKPAETAKLEAAVAPPKQTPGQATVKPKATHKKLAEAREPVPRPPAAIPAGANSTKPR